VLRVLAVYNIKGGVGKTATAVNLAYLAAREGAPTLVWDLDPQGASSYYFRIKPKIKGGGKKLIRGKHDLDEFIKGTNYPNLDLIPSDFSLRHLDLLLARADKPERQLRRLLKSLADEYVYVFLDCPPSLSLLSESVLTAADVLISPIIPTTLSVRTLEQLRQFIDDKRLRKLRLLLFFTMVDKRKNLHRQLMQTLPRQFPDFLDIYIAYASEVERMGVERAVLSDFAPKSEPARAYEALWKEMKLRLDSFA
jgi:chromosome partitioning protein